MKTLLVFPALSSPFYPKYVPSYELLRNECAARDIDIRILQFPGQEGSDGTFAGEFSPESSTAFALQEIARLEEDCIPFRTLGISYGSSISLATALRAKSTAYWQKSIVWGPGPLWQAWRVFGQGENAAQFCHGSHPCRSRDFYSQYIPVEDLIQQLLPVDITVGVGGNDKYVSKKFLNYLKSLSRDYLKSIPKKVTNQRNFKFIPGCQHNVVQDDIMLTVFRTGS